MQYSIEAILANDPFNLLEGVVQRFSGKKDETQRLVESFVEIDEFYQEHKRKPIRSKEDIIEFTFACRLEAIIGNNDKKQAISKEFAGHRLLNEQQANIDDITKDDPFGLLDDDHDNSIFDLKHVPATRASADFIAQRKPCKDFAEFKLRFQECQAELEADQRRLKKFRRESSITAGEFFVLNGVMLYVAQIEKTPNKTPNRRLRCIFANGTESNMLLKSLAIGLYKDKGGSRVVAKESGYIYVARSLSKNPQIANLNNLYKIGHTKIPVKQRLSNAHEQATYLHAPVELVAIFRCYNINTQKLELLLHKFFSSRRLDIEANGKNPREWFIVPLPAIEKAIGLLIEGTIVDYNYDAETESLRRSV